MVGPFPVDQPRWTEVEQIVAHLRRVLGVPVWVLRLLSVEGGEGGRDGHVTYHVEAQDRPAAWPEAYGPGHPAAHAVAASDEALRGPRPEVRDAPRPEVRDALFPEVRDALCPEVRDALFPDALRAPWATTEGLRDALGWAADALAAAGRPLTGAPEQHKTGAPRRRRG